MDVIKGWERRQKAYKRLPRSVRYLLVLVAFLLLPAGVIAMFTPLAVFEVGSIFIFTSLTLLSFEFSWAHGLLLWFRKRLANKKFRLRLTLFMLLVAAGYISLAALWLWKR